MPRPTKPAKLQLEYVTASQLVNVLNIITTQMTMLDAQVTELRNEVRKFRQVNNGEFSHIKASLAKTKVSLSQLEEQQIRTAKAIIVSSSPVDAPEREQFYEDYDTLKQSSHVYASDDDDDT